MAPNSGQPAQISDTGPAEVRHGRLVYLEAGRGIASVVVLLHHLVLAFRPSLDEGFPRGLKFTPLYGLINGGAAVAFFFVLSGFVLSLSLIRTPTRGRLATSIVKRLPRLALPAVVTLVAGCLILLAGYRHYIAAGHVSGSPWLASFGNAMFPDSFAPSLYDAVRNSVLVFVQSHKFYYNSNLWTMRGEYVCSLAVLLAAFFVGRFIRRKLVSLTVILGVCLSLLLVNKGLALCEFGIGMGLAVVHSSWRIVLKPVFALAISLSALMLISCDDARITTVAAAMLLFAMTTSPAIEHALSGTVGYWLGKCSFPLYLVHTLVIVTIGSEVYTAMFAAGHGNWLGLLVTSLVVVVCSVAAALPLMLLDDWWVPTLNKGVARIMKPVKRLVAGAA